MNRLVFCLLVAASLWGPNRTADASPLPQERPSNRPVQSPSEDDLKKSQEEFERLEAAMAWPLVDGFHNPNKIVYDGKQLDDYVAYYKRRPTICGKGPTCELVDEDKTLSFICSIDYSHLGRRFQLDQLRAFLRSRIEGTKKRFSDKRTVKIKPFERDILYCVGLLEDAVAIDAIPEITELLRDESEHVRYAAIQALGELKQVSAIKELSLMLETDQSRMASKALVMIGSASIPALIDKAKQGKTVDARIFSIEALGKLGPEATSSIDVLIAAMQEKKDERGRVGYISSYAAAALGKIGDPRVIPELQKMSNARNTDVRDSSKKSIEQLEAIQKQNSKTENPKNQRSEVQDSKTRNSG
ncbi:MAG: HEAT repeat domain-containing protein [Planctomycetota bacterium]